MAVVNITYEEKVQGYDEINITDAISRITHYEK